MKTQTGMIAVTHDNGVVEVLIPSLYENAEHIVTCGTCGREWDNSVVTAVTPAPAGRCPFEHEHESEDDAETQPEMIDLTPNADGFVNWARTVLRQTGGKGNDANVARKVLAEYGLTS